MHGQEQLFIVRNPNVIGYRAENSRVVINDLKDFGCNDLLRLDNQVSVINGINVFLNFVIGVGIFMSPGTILLECGSVGMAFVLWIVSAVITLLTLLPLAELCSIVTKPGGNYIYIHEAFRDFHPFYGHLPAFLFVWVNFFFLRPAAAAIQTYSAIDYLYAVALPIVPNEFDTKYSHWLKNSVGVILLVITGAISTLNINKYLKIQDFTAYYKTMICLALILCGVYMFIIDQSSYININFENTTLSAQGLQKALFSGIYSFDGGSQVAGLTYEIKIPPRVVLHSMTVGLGITTATYLMLNISFLSVLKPSEITSSSAVAQLFTERLFGKSASVFMSFCVFMSSVSNNISGIFSSSRLGYAAAKEGHMVEILGYIHPSRLTPIPAVILEIFLAVIILLIGKSSKELINGFTLLLWINHGLTSVGLFILRKKRPLDYRYCKVPLWIPSLVLAISTFLVVGTLIIVPFTSSLAVISFLLLGVLIQYTFIYKKCSIIGTGKITTWLQKWLNVVPPS